MSTAFINNQWEITFVVSGKAGEVDGFTAISCADDVSPMTHYFDGESITAYSEPELFAKKERPQYRAVWSDKTMCWEDLRTLQDHKAAKWAQIKACREAALIEPLVTAYGEFDADMPSQKNITDTLILLQLAMSVGIKDSTTEFTLKDNSVVALDAIAMIDVGLALHSRTQAIYANARKKRNAIELASTVESVSEVSW